MRVCLAIYITQQHQHGRHGDAAAYTGGSHDAPFHYITAFFIIAKSKSEYASPSTLAQAVPSRQAQAAPHGLNDAIMSFKTVSFARPGPEE